MGESRKFTDGIEMIVHFAHGNTLLAAVHVHIAF